MSQAYQVSALAKGLRILTLFTEQRRELRLTDIAELTGLPVATAFRLLRTLESSGYVAAVPEGGFRPGTAVLSLGFAALQAFDVVEAAKVPLRALAESTGETVNLGVLAGPNVQYLLRIRNTDLVTASIVVGSLLPAACASMGKVMLAQLSESDLASTLERVTLTACSGPNAVRTIKDLRIELDIVRAQGWAGQDEEVARGLRSVAAPVRDQRGAVVAAINLAVPSVRWPMKEVIGRFKPALLRTADEISRSMGYLA